MVEQEKLDWLESIGAKEFKHPMKWSARGHLFSEEYIKKTPLMKIKAAYEATGGCRAVEHDNECRCKKANGGHTLAVAKALYELNASSLSPQVDQQPLEQE